MLNWFWKTSDLIWIKVSLLQFYLVISSFFECFYLRVSVIMQMLGKRRAQRRVQKTRNQTEIKFASVCNYICIISAYKHVGHFTIVPILHHVSWTNLWVLMVREYNDTIHYMIKGSGEQVTVNSGTLWLRYYRDFTFHSNWMTFLSACLLNWTWWDRKGVLMHVVKT